MAQALSKQVKNMLVRLRDGIRPLRVAVTAARTWVNANLAAVNAWPVDAHGNMVGYSVSKADLGKVKALLDALAALAVTHADALAFLEGLGDD